MKIETMQKYESLALSGALGTRFTFLRTRFDHEWAYSRQNIRAGIMRRYIRLQQENARLKAELAELYEGVDDYVDNDAPCPECHGEIGHRIDCPRGIAFAHD